jgi:predicted Abi (CAAX) family protease
MAALWTAGGRHGNIWSFPPLARCGRCGFRSDDSMIRRVARAFRTWPSVRDAVELLVALVVFALAAATISGFTSLAHWSPREIGTVSLLAMRALLAPALGEELIFRAALVPSAGDGARPIFGFAPRPCCLDFGM